MNGKLYICATPIGNLKDITLRVLEILNFVDLIAAEDTRRTLKLLNHFDIKKPLTSYFEHNKQFKGEKIIKELKGGKNVALVSDAGTPIISDPGDKLILECIENGIEIESAPGPCALIMAITLSGIDSKRFLFEGFLPVKIKEKKERLEEIKSYPHTLVFYEAPHKIKATLKCMAEVFSNRKISIHREMTKKFEETLRLTINEAVEYFEQNQPVGEFVIIVEGAKEGAKNPFSHLSIPEHVDFLISQGIEKKEAIKKCAKDRGIPKREVYGIYLGE